LQWVRGDDFRPDLLFDGAHNPAGARALAAHLRTLDREPPVVLFGAMHGKLLGEMFEHLIPCVHSLVVARPDVQRAEDPEEVAAIARSHGAAQVEVVADAADALQVAYERAGSDRYVLVTGSLYLVGQVLGLLERHPQPGPVSM
jgi:dihydrofolate synthase/folylpolyglutamate synthase